MKDVSSQLRSWNRLYKRLDDAYYRTARKFDMTETELWITYIIREHEGPLTQTDICNITYESKQTINSALKKMEGKGLIGLKTVDGNKKSKFLTFTPEGEKVAEATADKILQAEENAIKAMGSEEMTVLIDLYKSYLDTLEEEMDKIR